MQLYAPIFVDFAYQKRQLHEVMIGFLTACFPLSMMCFSFTVSRVNTLLGKRKSLLLSLCLAFIAAFLYGVVYYVEHTLTFIVLSILGRLIHGLEDVLFEVMAIHYLQNVISMNKDKAFATYKMGGSVGFILGGVIAPVLCYFTDHFQSFMLYGYSFLILLGVAYYIIPTDAEAAEL